MNRAVVDVVAVVAWPQQRQNLLNAQLFVSAFSQIKQQQQT
jgi:hypothetical protein